MRSNDAGGARKSTGFPEVLVVDSKEVPAVTLVRLPHFEAIRVRFGAKCELGTRLSQKKRELAEKTLINTALRRLMCKHLLSQRAAYRRLRRHSMDTNLNLAEVAQRVVDQISAMVIANVNSGTKSG